MKGKKPYVITTSLYAVVGIIAVVFFFLGAFSQNLVLTLVSFAAVFVAFDNVGCKDRKKKYLG